MKRIQAAPRSEPRLDAEWFWCDRHVQSQAFMLPIAPRGLHREMLTAAWWRGARLPNDPAQIQRAVGASADEWAALWPLVAPLWRVDGDVLINDEQLATYTEARRQQLLKRSRAVAGARARWGATGGRAFPCSSDAQAFPEHVPMQSALSLQLDVQQERTARRAREISTPVEKAVENPVERRLTSTWRRACAIAHLAIERYPDDFTSQADYFKQRCREQGIDPFEDLKRTGRQLYRRVLDAVIEQRRRRGGVAS